MKKNYLEKFFLTAILLLALILRFINLNWDQGYHLHPDERFLTMVGNAMHIPGSLAEYLNPKLSLMNPANIDFGFFVYGLFPISLNKVVAVLLNTDSYGSFTLQGRAISAFVDFLVVLLVYKTVSLLEKRYHLPSAVKLYAALFYAIAVLPIQLAHFFTVDSFLNFFLFASFYCTVRFAFERKHLLLIPAAIFFGLALSSKISAMYMAPLLLLIIASEAFSDKKTTSLKRLLKHITPKTLTVAVLCMTFFLLLSYIVIRLGNPYMFADSNMLNPTISPEFIQNVRTLKSWDGPDTWFPPGIQWISKKPVIFALTNLAIFGVGLPFFFFILLGIVALIEQYRKKLLMIILFWVIGFFLYQSVQFVKNMRYFIIIYPFLAMFAAIGFVYLTSSWRTLLKGIMLATLFFWPLSFLSIYLQPHSRVTASRWIYNHIPSGSFIANESWDDPLPLLIPEFIDKKYQGTLAPVFDPDTPEKWKEMNEILAKSDYYILSSNRAWGSIPTVPQKYPLMSKFYRELFAGKRGFKKIAEFESYPSLRYFGIPITIQNDWADESFTVYDHPKVIIFQRIK